MRLDSRSFQPHLQAGHRTNCVMVGYSSSVDVIFCLYFLFRISNITMETAVEVGLDDASEVKGSMARLIEACVCPPGYTGLSCQVMIPV